MDAAKTFTLGKSWSLILTDMGVAPSDVLRRAGTVSYTHLTLPTIVRECRSRWSPYH